MTNYEKRQAVLDALTDAARSIHGGHDYADALHKGLGGEIPLEKCERKRCVELVRAIGFVKGTRSNGWGGQ